MAGLGFAFVIVALLMLVLSIVIPLWVYSDAQRNSSDSALLWALVVFFGNLLGLLLYLLIGRDGAGGQGGTRSQF
ncbi:PLDc N-terminal domain-containing protein [Natronoarchaeum rubrum]|uniref:PLDc N-terminal domain-containing protein n=1 Tax=Natronoarchaeum rubrum TaxID=755311 RepID=UPI002110FC4E|nr:PLDc N-terminal domain-containing protein [Natronoarchaeum rubrum]